MNFDQFPYWKYAFLQNVPDSTWANECRTIPSNRTATAVQDSAYDTLQTGLLWQGGWVVGRWGVGARFMARVLVI